MSGVSFIYPPAGNFSDVAASGLVNIFDILEMSYTSSWDALNVTLFCLQGDSTTDFQVWNAISNPIASSGTFRLDSIDSIGFNILKFPTPCHFMLTQYGNNNVNRNAESFQVVSEAGTSTTYRPTSTSSRTTSTSTSASASETSGSSPSTSTTKPIVQGASLSTGAKAGIGIGVALIVLVIGALAFVVFRLRERINKPAQEQPHGPPEENKPAFAYNMHELEQTSRVELPAQQQARVRPNELE